MKIKSRLSAVFTLSALALSLSASAASNATQTLKELFAEQWEYQLKTQPETATVLGDYRYNSRWTDLSLAAFKRQRLATEAFLKRFEAIDPSTLSEQDQLSLHMMKQNLEEELEDIDLKNYEMPLDQFSGVHLNWVQLVDTFPFETTQHYEDYLERLNQLPTQVDQVIRLMTEGKRDGLMPPKYLLEKVVTQIQQIERPTGINNVFARPAAQFAASIPSDQHERLRKAVLAAVDRKVRPAYAKLEAYVAKQYAPEGRVNEGLWSLPDGEKRYQFAIRKMTTTTATAEETHQLGLREVARIEGEMTAIAQKLGYSNLAAFRDAVAKEARLKPISRQQIVDLYNHYISTMQPELPKLFGLLPKSSVEVRAVPEYAEKGAAGAYYMQGTPDGKRPGIVYVNTSDYQDRNLSTVEDTAYHEGVPGHHLQIAIAQTLPLPAFRQQAGYTAYIEGWALYSERLGKEVGFYQDPYSDYGRLCGELLRANRLVLDTGVHYKRWTRQQMIDFFHAHPSDDEPSIQSETDRYVALPGQALAYKMGQLKILELREKAQKALGDRFDIRDFHDQVLNGGAMPLNLLEDHINAWITAQQKA
jgi:uncharacterized protein (DUF885 family)